MNQPKLARTLQLLMLLSNNHFTTIEEICRRFEFSERTFYRYIDTFRQVGLAVKKNDNGAYRLEIQDKLSRRLSDLLHFTEEEEIILREAIDSIDSSTLAREQLKKKLCAVYDYKVIANMAVPQKDLPKVHQLKTAIENHQQVVLSKYRSANSNTTSDRRVEPYKFTDAMDQIWCYEIETGTVKTFKISRIYEVVVLDNPWEHAAEHEVGYVDIFRMHSTQQIPICLRLSMRAANLLMEEYPLSRDCLTTCEDGRSLLRTNVCRFEGVARFILGLYDEIDILESPELKEYIRYKISTMIK